jgi:hypothetical protein
MSFRALASIPRAPRLQLGRTVDCLLRDSSRSFEFRPMTLCEPKLPNCSGDLQGELGHIIE